MNIISTVKEFESCSYVVRPVNCILANRYNILWGPWMVPSHCPVRKKWTRRRTGIFRNDLPWICLRLAHTKWDLCSGTISQSWLTALDSKGFHPWWEWCTILWLTGERRTSCTIKLRATQCWTTDISRINTCRLENRAKANEINFCEMQKQIYALYLYC